MLTEFSETSTTGAKSTTSGLERTEYTPETITTRTEEMATNTPEPSGTLNDFNSFRCMIQNIVSINIVILFLIVYEIVSTNEIDDVLANFAKRIGNIMPWDIGYFPNATEDSRFNRSIIYEQYEQFADKSSAMSACLKNPQCPWVFDEKCDGIGPFIVGFRAKTTYNCPTMGMTMNNGQECSDNCLYEKG